MQLKNGNLDTLACMYDTVYTESFQKKLTKFHKENFNEGVVDRKLLLHNLQYSEPCQTSK